MTRTMAGLHLHFSKLIIFVFLENFSAEKSKSSAEFKLQLLQLDDIQPVSALSIMGTKDEGDGGGRVDGPILLSHQAAQHTRSNYGQVNKHL